MDLFRLQKFTTTYFQTNGRVRWRYVFTYRKQWKWAGLCLLRGPDFHCFLIKCGSEFQKVACAVKDSIKQLISKLTQSQIFLDERNCFLNFFRFCTRGQFLFCSLLNGVLQWMLESWNLLKRDQAKNWRNRVSIIYIKVYGFLMECAIRQTELSLSQLGSHSLIFAGPNGKLPSNAKEAVENKKSVYAFEINCSRCHNALWG